MSSKTPATSLKPSFDPRPPTTQQTNSATPLENLSKIPRGEYDMIYATLEELDDSGPMDVDKDTQRLLIKFAQYECHWKEQKMLTLVTIKNPMASLGYAVAEWLDKLKKTGAAIEILEKVVFNPGDPFTDRILNLNEVEKLMDCQFLLYTIKKKQLPSVGDVQLAKG